MLFSHLPRFTREGWYFLGVLLFVIGGAVAQELNLLLVLSGMMLGPLIFHARIVSLTLRRLRVRRRVPRRICAGEPLHVRIGVINPRRHLSAWLLNVQDQLRLVSNAQHVKAQSPTKVDVIVPRVSPGEEFWVSYRAHLTRRGRYAFGPMVVSTRFPLGLLKASRIHAVKAELLVSPQLGHLTPEWTKLIQAEHSGTQQPLSRQGLTEGEFYGLREWRPGDSRRWVHWRTSARLNTLAVRQFEQQRREAFALLLDLWLPPEPTTDQIVRVELAISFAATAITELGRAGSRRLVIACAGTNVDHWTAAASPALAEELMEALAVVDGGEGTLPSACRHLVAHWPRGTPGVVISTRPSQLRKLSHEFSENPEVLTRLHRIAWIDVSSAHVERFFRME